MLQAFDGHNDLITGVALDPVGLTRIASASYDRTYDLGAASLILSVQNRIKIWNTESKPFSSEQTLDGHIDHVTAVDWNPKTTGVLASGGWVSYCLWSHVSLLPNVGFSGVSVGHSRRRQGNTGVVPLESIRVSLGLRTHTVLWCADLH